MFMGRRKRRVRDKPSKDRFAVRQVWCQRPRKDHRGEPRNNLSSASRLDLSALSKGKQSFELAAVGLASCNFLRVSDGASRNELRLRRDWYMMI